MSNNPPTRTYFALVALCGRCPASEQHYDWATDTRPDFIEYDDFAQQLGHCLNARRDLIDAYGCDLGFDALAWDALLIKNPTAYAMGLWVPAFPIAEDFARSTLARLRNMLREAQQDEAVLALRETAQSKWASSTE